MKSIEDILKAKEIEIDKMGKDGGMGRIKLSDFEGMVIFSKGAGWDHVSVSPYPEYSMPTWNQMCEINDIFFYDDEATIEIHPKKSEYVNNADDCLHIWRCYYKDMILPPSVLVGIRDGQTREEFYNEIKEAYKIAGEKSPF